MRHPVDEVLPERQIGERGLFTKASNSGNGGLDVCLRYFQSLWHRGLNKIGSKFKKFSDLSLISSV